MPNIDYREANYLAAEEKAILQLFQLRDEDALNKSGERRAAMEKRPSYYPYRVRHAINELKAAIRDYPIKRRPEQLPVFSTSAHIQTVIDITNTAIERSHDVIEAVSTWGDNRDNSISMGQFNATYMNALSALSEIHFLHQCELELALREVASEAAKNPNFSHW